MLKIVFLTSFQIILNLFTDNMNARVICPTASILVEMKNLTYSWEDVAILRTLFAFSFQFPSNVINKKTFAFIGEARIQLPVRLYL